MKTKAELVELLNSHDCHLSEMDGCDCIDIRHDLAVRNYKTGSVPYKYHSKLVTGIPQRTQLQIERDLYEEVREDRI